jgi:hypothetical protein
MVVLPIEYIKTQNIYNAISKSLDDDLSVRLNYSELYNKVKQLLRREISHRDYHSCLKSMVDEKRLHRHEENEGKKKIATVYYSLTSTAKKESQFGILGIDSEKQKLRRLYQLLFFFLAIKPPNPISIRKLDRGLSNISISRKDLIIESHFHIRATGYIETNYKPVNSYKFRIVEYSDQGRKITHYYYKQLSFSLKDIIKHMKRQQKIPFDDIKQTPPINYIHFPEVTEEEIKKAMQKLRQENLIKPIQNTFDRYDRQISFIISDDSLLDLINKIWRIHDLQFERLRKKITYVEQPSEKEKEWLKFEYGDNAASIFIHNASRFRKGFIMKNKKVNGDIARIQRRIEGLDDRINQRILNINNKYGNIIEKFDFPSNILEGVCLRKIFLN